MRQVQAARFRIDGYERAQAEDLDKLKEQLAGGHPVIFGMDVSDDFYRLKSGIYNDLSAEECVTAN
ncbi:MAG: C1 family peptidase [Methylococcus sp.]